MNKPAFLLLACLLLTCCTSPAQPTPPSRMVTVYASPAAQPWLIELYACANDLSLVLRVDAAQADMVLRLGEPESLNLPAYEIDQDEILIVTHPDGPVQNLTLQEAQALFAGQGEAGAQIWVYAADEDVQVAFDRLVMKGRGVTPLARLASGPQEMSDILNSESNAVGILPRHWKMGSLREVYSAGPVPVLVLLKAGPIGAVRELAACLQK